MKRYKPYFSEAKTEWAIPSIKKAIESALKESLSIRTIFAKKELGLKDVSDIKDSIGTLPYPEDWRYTIKIPKTDNIKSAPNDLATLIIPYGSVTTDDLVDAFDFENVMFTIFLIKDNLYITKVKGFYKKLDQLVKIKDIEDLKSKIIKQCTMIKKGSDEDSIDD